MTYLLRKIDNKVNWDQEPEELKWLYGEIPADLLNDFSTKDNRISVYELDQDQENLERIIAALASNREKADKLDFIIVKKKIIENLDISMEQKNGATPDFEVNGFHIDLAFLTGNKLNKLAREFWLNGEIYRYTPPRILKIIANSFNNGHIPVEHIKKQESIFTKLVAKKLITPLEN